MRRQESSPPERFPSVRFLVLLLTAAVSGVSGWTLAKWMIIPETKVIETVRVKQVAAPPTVDNAEIDRLRKRIDELESELAAQFAAGEVDLDAAVNKAVDKMGVKTEPKRESFMERMARLKKENPQHYEAVVRHHEDYQRHRRLRAAEKADFFESIDLSSLTPQARDTHRRLLEQIEMVARQREKIDDWMHGPHTDEERSQNYSQLAKMYGELRNLYEEERYNLLVSSVKSMGLNSRDVENFVADIQTIYNATQIGGHPNARNEPMPLPPPPPPPQR